MSGRAALHGNARVGIASWRSSVVSQVTSRYALIACVMCMPACHDGDRPKPDIGACGAQRRICNSPEGILTTDGGAPLWPYCVSSSALVAQAIGGGDGSLEAWYTWAPDGSLDEVRYRCEADREQRVAARRVDGGRVIAYPNEYPDPTSGLEYRFSYGDAGTLDVLESWVPERGTAWQTATHV